MSEQVKQELSEEEATKQAAEERRRVISMAERMDSNETFAEIEERPDHGWDAETTHQAWVEGEVPVNEDGSIDDGEESFDAEAETA